ncbi:MAG: IPExxxVDY family protein [Cyclobacteriaceae bacterium]|nr:IPExxxVDY family protein [Cyclobacteriaceae bacterium HetDA_MAG_MS6]
MKKNKLVTGYEYNFDVYGIVSQTKGYTLAWNLNQIHFFDLKKAEDIKIALNNNASMLISNFKQETDFVKVHLLRNKLVSSNSKVNRYLLPELQQFDYFLKIENLSDDVIAEDFISSIKQLPIIDYLVNLDLTKIKLKENLLY